MSFVSSFQKTAVFISGGGSCLQALLELSEFHDIRLVVTNKKYIAGALKAQRFGVPVLYIDKNKSFEQVQQILILKQIQKIVLAGFMKMIPESFLSLWKDRIFNIHPSLLPEFKGLHAFEQAFDSDADVGVTIHHVISEMDSGEIVLQMQSSSGKSKLEKNEAALRLRRTEQHLLREYTYKGSALCLRF